MSEIRATTISDLAGTGPATLTGQSAAKALLKVDQRSTQAILSSFNVSSITDIGTAQTRMTFSSAMSDGNYFPAGGTDFGADPYSQFQFQTTIAASCTVWNSPDAGQSTEDGVVSCAIHGDLA